MQETKDRNNNDHGEGNGNCVGETHIVNLSYKGLLEFRKTTPPSFYGDYDSALAKSQVIQLEKIFTVMGCTNAKMVAFAIYMLEGKGKHWWKDDRSLLESRKTKSTWKVFLATFFNKHFTDSVKNDKEVEFMQLKQGSITVGQYVAKFEEL